MNSFFKLVLFSSVYRTRAWYYQQYECYDLMDLYLASDPSNPQNHGWMFTILDENGMHAAMRRCVGTHPNDPHIPAIDKWYATIGKSSEDKRINVKRVQDAKPRRPCIASVPMGIGVTLKDIYDHSKYTCSHYSQYWNFNDQIRPINYYHYRIDNFQYDQAQISEDVCKKNEPDEKADNDDPCNYVKTEEDMDKATKVIDRDLYAEYSYKYPGINKYWYRNIEDYGTLPLMIYDYVTKNKITYAAADKSFGSFTYRTTFQDVEDPTLSVQFPCYEIENTKTRSGRNPQRDSIAMADYQFHTVTLYNGKLINACTSSKDPGLLDSHKRRRKSRSDKLGFDDSNPGNWIVLVVTAGLFLGAIFDIIRHPEHVRVTKK